MKYILMLAPALLLACGEEGEEAPIEVAQTTSGPRPDVAVEVSRLNVEDVWGRDLALEIYELGWSDEGAMRIDFGLVDAESGLPVVELPTPAFIEDGVDLGAEALYTLNRARDIDVNLVLDLSRSVAEAGAVDALRTAALRLVDSLPKEARVAVTTFATDYEVAVDLGEPGLESTLAQLAPPEGRPGHFTNLWGAIRAGARLLEQASEDNRPRILVVFTDGRDNVAEASFVEAVEALSGGRVTVYAVGLGGEVDGDALQQLAGDRYANVDRPGALTAVFADVGTRLGDRMVLDYVSPKQSGRHTLDFSLGGEAGAGFQLDFQLP